MPNVKVLNMAGAEVGEIALNDAVFAVEVSKAVLHSAVRAYLLNQRQGTQSTLTRSEVSGGGKKPWRQKGTGRARQGSTRSPQWTHGGIALGPKPRDYHVDLNKKVKRLALLGALSGKVAESAFVVIDAITATEYKTRVMADMLKAVNAGKKALVVFAEKNDMAVASCKNIPGVKTAYTNTLNVYDILNCDTVVIEKAATEKITEVYA
ncbi:MAG: 50S ribosomal protein L4 [Clostridia bacterium]|nr:50S ribosomal protein L4 [Clostridia bacterium]